MDNINANKFKSKKEIYKSRDNARHFFQFLWFIITNSYFEGFKTGKIYTGNLKKLKTFKGDKYLRKMKYAILLIFVILLPLFLVDVLGQGSPFFCKLICPVGMLEGGIPLVLLNKGMRSAIGFLYYWKGFILILTIILSIIIYRPFCKYVCPLGAIYSLFNPISMFRYRLDKDKCISCGKCKRVCQMNVDPVKNCNHAECIRCGRCKNACPTQAIEYGFKNK